MLCVLQDFSSLRISQPLKKQTNKQKTEVPKYQNQLLSFQHLLEKRFRSATALVLFSPFNRIIFKFHFGYLQTFSYTSLHCFYMMLSLSITMLCCATLSRSVMSDCLRPHGLQPTSLLWSRGILQARILEWVAMPSSNVSSKSRDQTRSPTLQVDSLPSKPPGKPKNTGVGSLSSLQGIFPIQKLNQGLLHCRQILYQLSYQGSSYMGSN